MTQAQSSGDVGGAEVVADLVARARAGQPRAVARLVSMVESAAPQLREVMSALAPDSGKAYVIGITGAPGVGKSTTTSALVRAYRAAGQRVGVLAVDPSSPFSGGALLGDRVRMQEHATDPNVFIRSMASRGHLGGLAAATPQALRVLDATGVDVVLVETVGVGQSEIEVAAAVDTTLVLLAPGMGDGIQAAKAGILEIGDVFGVNKADRDGASATARELRSMVALGNRQAGDWVPEVVSFSAATGQGIDALLVALAAHRDYLLGGARLLERRVRRAAAEVEALTVATLRARIGEVRGDARLESLARSVAEGRTDAYTAADRLAEALAGSGKMAP